MDIKHEINTFIKNKESTGAVLITGDWGCGKTYLIRGVAEELNEGNEFAVVIVSLFGLESIEHLNKKVKESIFYTQVSNKNGTGIQKMTSKFKRIIAPIAGALSDYSKIAKGLNTAFSLNLYDFVIPKSEIICNYNDEVVKKQLVLIFDDFERCKIDEVDLLGAINEYSENIGIKTIIVADEKHIKGGQYSEFKEKVIAHTIRLSPNFDEIITAIVDSYTETSFGYIDFLKENIGLLCQIFNESKQENIRTFKTYIVSFERVYNAWKNSDIPVENMPQVLYAFGVIHFEVKANNYIKDPKYGYMFAESKLNDKYSKLITSYQLGPLQRFIAEGIWDETQLLNTLRIKFAHQSVTYYEAFLNWDFWNLDDTIVSQGLKDALDLAYDGLLCCHDLVSLLGRVHRIKEFNLTLPHDVDYKKLYKGFKIRETAIKAGKMQETRDTILLSPDQVSLLCDDAKLLHKEIELLRDRNGAWDNRRLLLSFLASPATTDNSKLRCQSIVSFDNELLIGFTDAYKEASNSTKRCLYHTLKDIVFDDKFVSTQTDIIETVKNLQRFVSSLAYMAETEADSFTRYIIKDTISHVNEFINKIADCNDITME